LYMCHFAVIWGVTQFIRVVCKAPEIRINGSSYSSLTMFQTLLALLSVIALSLGLAHLSHRLIEEPFRRWSRKILLNPEAK
jgi:peptidoglycan/LPS O-acetylase OafA/YrhL